MTYIDRRIVEAFNAAHDFRLEDHLILLAAVGSHAHGTHIPPSDPQAIDDVDFMGIVVPPVHRVLGLREWEHWMWKAEELDVVLYSARKAVTLLLKSNPNILGLLWLPSMFYHHSTATGQQLVARRELFSSKRAYPAFIGYAHDQLKRMEAYDAEAMAQYEALTQSLGQWVNVPRWVAMNGPDFEEGLRGLPVNREIVEPDLRALRKLHRKHFSGYLGEKRKALVRQHGYDCKNAAHLIRLMRMCVGFLETGELEVFRHDADELRAIKLGAWPLEAIYNEAERLQGLAEAALARSDLPETPDEVAAEALLISLYQETFRRDATRELTQESQRLGLY